MKKLIYLILIGLVSANILAFYTLTFYTNKLEVDFFDVGQGDSILIKTPSNIQVLIDGGPDNTVIEKLGRAMPFYDRTIDLVILSHSDSDHLFGLLEVLKRYKVLNILWLDSGKVTEQVKEWKRLVSLENANLITGDKVILDKNIFLEVFYPESLKENDSIVNRLNYNNVSFLFTGDQSGYGMKADVLKVSHHGSKASTTEEFVKEVDPKTAVISVGENNKYGHPSPEVLEILEKSGIQVLRTDEKGDIKILSDGKTYDSP